MSELRTQVLAELLLAAAKRRKDLGRAYEQTKELLLAASCEELRLEILQIADLHPGLKAVEFNVYFEQDKGFMFQTVASNAIVNEHDPGQIAAYERHGDPEDDVYDLDVSPEMVGFIAEFFHIEIASEAEYTARVPIEELRGVSW